MAETQRSVSDETCDLCLLRLHNQPFVLSAADNVLLKSACLPACRLELLRQVASSAQLGQASHRKDLLGSLTTQVNHLTPT